MPHFLITITRRNGLRYKDAYLGCFTPERGEYLEPSEGAAAQYAKGWSPPNYPLPAIPLKVVWGTQGEGYLGIVYIDELNDPDDPILAWGWDTWNQCNI